MGWAVQESLGHLETHSRRLDWFQGRDIPRLIFVSTLVLWNAVGVGLLLLVLFGNTTTDAATRDVVFNAVLWPLLAGDLALAAVGSFGRGIRRRRS